MKTKILVLGATGMLGHVMFKHFFNNPEYQVFGTVRSKDKLNGIFTKQEQSNLISKIDAANFDSFINAFAEIKPGIVINCIGIIKQSDDAKNYYNSININSFLPHRIARLCALGDSRLIHISTDCVFDGQKGGYLESDNSNATDLYGKSKYLGEVDYPFATTIRTSIIGHELHNQLSLVDWFLAQNGSVKGYTNVVFSGVTTYELAQIIQIYVIANKNLSGLYQVSATPISKFDLLNLVAKIYKKEINITRFDEMYTDRSLNSDKFRQTTGFLPKPWEKMIEEMYHNYQSHSYYMAKKTS
jgi:dTDP-4-dehydrorhamnose reductase